MKSRNIHKTLRWIVRILRQNKVPFRISGGLAARAYCSKRSIADIDIEISKKDFNKIIQKIKTHLVFGPKYYKDKNWHLFMLTLNHYGQLIDICAADDSRIFNKKTRRWIKLKSSPLNNDKKIFFNLRLPIIPEDELVNYKRQIFRQVDRSDLKCLVPDSLSRLI